MKTDTHTRFLRALVAALPLLLSACGPMAGGAPTTPAGVATPTAIAQAAPALLPSTAATAPAPPPAPPATATAVAASPTAASVAARATPVPATATAQPAAALPPLVCTPGALTPAQTEGPYYKTNPPQRASLVEPGMSGTKITLTGYVVTADCTPVAGARVDIWQAGADGQYDNSGYRLRGYVLTDQAGRYAIETIVPGLYPGRTGHIHVKVQAPGGPILTTQLYFPGEAQNSRDAIYNARLLLDVQDGPAGKMGSFTFVVPRR